MELVHGLGDGPSPGQTVCFQAGESAARGDLRRDLVKQRDAGGNGVARLQQVLDAGLGGAFEAMPRDGGLSFSAFLEPELPWGWRTSTQPSKNCSRPRVTCWSMRSTSSGGSCSRSSTA